MDQPSHPNQIAEVGEPMAAVSESLDPGALPPASGHGDVDMVSPEADPASGQGDIDMDLVGVSLRDPSNDFSPAQSVRVLEE